MAPCLFPLHRGCCCLLLLYPVVLLYLQMMGKDRMSETVQVEDDETTTTVKGRKGQRKGDKPGKSQKGRGKEMVSPLENSLEKLHTPPKREGERFNFERESRVRMESEC